MAFVFSGSKMPDSGVVSGANVVFKHREDAEGVFTFSAQTVSISGPAGDTAPSVTAVPGGSNNPQLLMATTPGVAGEYRVNWSFIADGQPFARHEEYLVAWTELRDKTRRLLRVDRGTFTDNDADMAALAVLDSLSADSDYLLALPSYSQLVESDRRRFDAGVAYMAAAWSEPFVPQQVPRGPLTALVIGTDEFHWGTPRTAISKYTLSDMFIDAAIREFSATQTLGPSTLATQHNAPHFAASGRRRAFGGCGGYSGPMPWQLLGDPSAASLWFSQQFSVWLDVGAKQPWSWCSGSSNSCLRRW